MKKNILIFAHSYVTPFFEINNQYTKLFDKKNHEVTVVYLTGEPSDTVRNQHGADHLIFLNLSKKSARGLKITAIKKMLALCRDKKFSVVFCHRYKPAYIMLWVARFCKIPIIFSVMHELGTLRNRFRKIAVRYLAQDNIFFAGVSNAVQQDLRQSLNDALKSRVITLHNTIDVDTVLPQLLTKAEARETLGISPNDFIFGNIGRLAINKDQRTLIRAFANIKKSCPTAKLVIIGKGALEEELKQLAISLQITNEVIFAGFVPNAFRLTKAFDVMVSSSTQEAFGLVLLEAMIAKTPVIATKVNGIPEVIDNSGILIDPKNTLQLASEMLKAYNMNTNARKCWGQKGYDRVIQHFSLARFNEIFWELPIMQTNNTL